MLVLVAAAIFPIVGMMSFAIDVSHWFDYSRNLQNRADAAALAAGAQFGGLCFAGGNAGTTTSGAQSAMGKWAQLYTGASAGESFVYSGTGGGTATGRVPYSDSAVSASPTSGGSDGPGTGWNVTTNGYVNNTTGASPPVTSPLTLRAGIANINNFWLALNASDFAPNASGANTSFTMGPTSPTPPSFCSSDPTYDQTDSQCRNQAHGQTTGPCAVGPMIDVKLTQKNVPLFIPLFSGLTPTIHGHARVTLEGEASTPAAPIAVGDTAFTPCVKVNLMDASTNMPLPGSPIPLPNRTQAQPTDPVQWTSNPTSFTMPASENVYVQPILSDCQNSIQTYDDSTNTGLLLINPKGASASGATLTGDVPPQISSDGVTVSGSCANGTQYLNEGTCNVTVNAGVAFGTGVNVNNKANVGLIVHTWNNTTNSWNLNPTSGSTSLHKPGTAGCPATMWCGDPTIPDTSGIAQFEITWSQTSGKIGAANCASTPTPAACSGTFGIRAQSFGACDGCDQPDSSGPIIFARISQGASSDLDTFAPGTVSNVVFTLKLAGLNTAQYVGIGNPPPTVLRFSASSNHQTGLVDCGQGNGTNADAWAIYGGCGPSNSHFTPPLNPLYVNTRNTCGTPPGPPWPNGNQQDCVQTTPGQRRQGIICPLILRVVKGAFSTTCNDPSAGSCLNAPNNWDSSKGHPPGNDRRAITMILTSQVDLAAGTGSPQFWLPIRQFATFYVVGWDSKLKPQCGDNAPFPTKGKKNQDNGAIWGYWINYTDFGIANGQLCPVSSTLPVNCVPALTR